MASANKESSFYALDRILKEMLEQELKKKRIQPEKVAGISKDVIDNVLQDLVPKIFSTLKANMPTLL